MNFSVRAASTANGVSSDFDAGSVMDSITLATHDVICRKDQTQAIDNGLFIVQPAGAASMVRHPDVDKGFLLPSGTTVEVREGTANGGKLFFVSTPDPIVVGEDPIAFAEPVISTATASSLAGKVPMSRLVATTAPITGGGDLSADRTLALTTSPAGQTPVGVTRSVLTTAPITGGGDLSADRTLDFRPTVVHKSAAYTAVTTDWAILVTTGAASFTITLYPAAGNDRRTLMIKKIDAGIGVVTVDGDGAETIDGAATHLLASVNAVVVIICDGSNWFIT